MARSVLLGWCLVGGLLAGCSGQAAKVSAPPEQIKVDPAKAARLQLRFNDRIGEAIGRPEAAPATAVSATAEAGLRRQAHQRPIAISSPVVRRELHRDQPKLGGAQ